MTKKSISFIIFIIFTVVIAYALIGFIISNKSIYIYNLVILYIISSAIILVEIKRDIYMNNIIWILLLSTFSLHLIYGQLYDLYYSSNWFDNFLHFFGSFSTALFFSWIITFSSAYDLLTRIVKLLLIACLSISSGTLFEILEFILDIIFKSNNQRGLMDTNMDIIFNIIGTTFACIIIFLFNYNSKYSNKKAN